MGYQGNYPPSTPLNPTQLGTGVVTTDAIANGAVIPADLSTGGPYWDTSGNVGIGTTSPANKLHVVGPQGAVASFPTILNQTFNILENNFHTRVAGVVPTSAAYEFGTYAYGSGDTNPRSGISMVPQSSYISFLTGSGSTAISERMRIDSSGNVGIGTSSPSQKLDVVGDLNVGSTIYTGTGVSTGDVRLELGYNRSGSGNSYIDFHSTSGTDYEARFIRTAGANGGLTISNTGTGGLYLQNDGAAQIQFNINGSERARIDSSGALWVGYTSQIFSASPYKVGISFDGSAQQGMVIKNTVNNAAGAAVRFVDYLGNFSGGGIYYTSSNSISYATSSDYRLKHDVAPIENGLQTISALNPVTYKWKVDNSYGEGFIAHELQSVIPHAVTGQKDAVNEDGSINAQGVDYSKIVVHLVAAIQELKAELDALKGTK